MSDLTARVRTAWPQSVAWLQLCDEVERLEAERAQLVVALRSQVNATDAFMSSGPSDDHDQLLDELRDESNANEDFLASLEGVSSPTKEGA